jgi:hypothetical protein
LLSNNLIVIRNQGVDHGGHVGHQEGAGVWLNHLRNEGSTSQHATLHLPPAHHETSKCDSPNETKIKEKQNETIPDSNSNLAKSMIHHNQTKEWTTWFLNLPLVESIDNKSTKFEV